MPMDWEKWQQKQGPRSGGPPDLDKVFENVKKFKGRLPSSYILIGIIVLIWLASGIYIVAPDEVGVIQRFGAYTRTTTPGPHYHLPYPVETVAKPKLTQIRRFEIGFRTGASGSQYREVPDEALMLTGDENIIDIRFIVQYRINDPIKFLFRIDNPTAAIQSAAEAAMREVIGRNEIDEALTGGKFEIQQDAEKTLQQIMDRYDSGLTVVAVQLQGVHPPKQVIDAFKDVASAREDQNRFINEAEGYANDILPEAKGRAAEQVNQAEAYKGEKIKRAQGEAARFDSQRGEYQKAKDVTRKRLYLEAMEQVLGRGRKFIMGPGSRGQVAPLLPLESLTGEPSAKKEK